MKTIKKIINDLAGQLQVRPIIILFVIIVFTSLLYRKNTVKDLDIILQNRGILEGDTIKITAVIEDKYLKKGEYGYNYVFLLKSVKYKGKKVTKTGETVTAYIPVDEKQDLHLETLEKVPIGMRVLLQGIVSYYKGAVNPGQFDSKEYNYNIGNLFLIRKCEVLQTGKKYSKLKNTLYLIKKRGEANLDRNLPEQDSGLLKAMIFGNRQEIDKEVKKSFQQNGIAHLLAISGLHISFIGMGLYKLLCHLPLPGWLCAVTGETIIVLYGIMVGFSTSTIRAITMYSIFLLGKVIFRAYDLISSACIAVVFLLILNVNVLGDTGFYLSFLAVFAIGLFYYGFSITVFKDCQTFFISLFVFLVTLPPLLNAYYQVAFYSVILNLCVIPPMSLLLPSGIILSVTGNGIIGLPFKWISVMILFFYKNICLLMEKSPIGRYNTGYVQGWKIFLYYAILFTVCFLLPYFVKRGKLILFSAATVSAVAVLCISPAKFGISFLDVGQGDCSIIQNDNGNIYIIDGGSSSENDVGTYRIIPFLKYSGVNEVEAVFLTHPDADHINGILELLQQQSSEHIKIKNIVIAEVFKNSEDFAEIFKLAKDSEVDIIYMKKGDILTDKSLSINCLYPETSTADSGNLNNSSLVLGAAYKELYMLFTGDVEMEGEKIIIDTCSPIDKSKKILKVAHHGSKTSSSGDFMEWFRPDIAIISSGLNNSYGHPHKETVERIEACGTRIFYTMKGGMIHIGRKKGEIYLKEFLSGNKSAD